MTRLIIQGLTKLSIVYLLVISASVSSSEALSVVEETETGLDPANSFQHEASKRPETGVVEKIVTPVTRWVEGILQSAPIMKASVYNREKDQHAHSRISLREAIALALDKKPGTVISADKVQHEGGANYLIRILSKNGTVSVVSVKDEETEK